MNAWQWPVGCRQTLSISVVFGNAVAVESFLCPLLPEEVCVVLNIVFSVAFLSTVAGGSWTMTLDPVDDWVVETETNLAPETREEDYLHCNYCKSDVQLESKHCWDCNKCVADYDHHCPWVNNCIGSANYKQFYVTIWSLFIMLAVAVAAVIVILIPNSSVDARRNALEWPQLEVLIVSICLLVVDGALLFLDGSLLAFHTYLCIANLTTYEYLTGKTSKKKQEAKMRKEAGENGHANGFGPSRLQHPVRTLHPVPPIDEDGSGSSEESSEDDGLAGAGEVFKSSFLAAEADGDVAKEVSNFMFGSRTATAQLPTSIGLGAVSTRSIFGPLGSQTVI